MRRRLLQSLKQGVRRAIREHMNFIYDIDLIARIVGRIIDLFAQAADILDSGIAGGIDFNDIQGPELGYRPAHFAVVARPALAAGEAIDCFSQNPSRAGFAGAPRPAEKIGVGDATASQSVEQSLSHRLLAD